MQVFTQNHPIYDLHFESVDLRPGQAEHVRKWCEDQYGPMTSGEWFFEHGHCGMFNRVVTVVSFTDPGLATEFKLRWG